MDDASSRASTSTVVDAWSAAGIVLTGCALAALNLDRGIWLDEFITLARTEPALAPPQFWRVMTEEQHPIAHYGLVYLTRVLGVETVGALRALNVLGVVWVAAALRHAVRRRVLSMTQACVVAALYASSKTFFLYAVELRGYHLCFAGSIALSCAWLSLRAGPPTRADLCWWGATLCLFVNTHYYALLFAGMLSLLLLVRPPPCHAWATRVRVAAVSLVAALPAIATWLVQAHETLNGKYFKYISAGLDESMRMGAHLFFNVTGFNAPAYVLVGLALASMLRARALRASRDLLALAAASAAVYALLIVVNAFVPLLRPRYLVAAGAGAITVVVGVLAAGPGPAPARTWPIFAFAVAVQLLAPTFDWFAPPYWKKSALMVAAATRACPETNVYAATEVHPDIAVRPDAPPLWLSGYQYYARQYGFTVLPLTRNGVVRPGARCPSLIWLEHIQRHVGAPIDGVLRRLQLTAEGKVSVTYADSGGVVWVAPF